jgi:nucleoside-diphosphate-sugar epimerase
MNILITGASGFVGKAVCQTLFNNNHRISAIVRNPAVVPHEYEVINANLNANTNLGDVLNSIDVVIHLAGRAHVLNDNSVDPYKAYAEINIDATNNLATQAAASGVKRFIFISSIKVNGEQTLNAALTELDEPKPEDDYGVTKLEAENVLTSLAEKSTMEVVIIRPPLVYGKGVKANFHNLIKLCKTSLPLPFGALHNKRSMVYIENLVDFINTCTTHPKAANETFLISDDEDISTTVLIRSIRHALGVPAWLIPIPQQWIVSLLKLMGKKTLAARLCGNLQVDISKAKTLLGWKPPYTFKQGIHKTIRKN